jgi:hypothetical protein
MKQTGMEGALDGGWKKQTPENIVNVLRQIKVATANGKTNPAACREAGITEQTYYRRRKEYGGLKGRRTAVEQAQQCGVSERYAYQTGSSATRHAELPADTAER